MLQITHHIITQLLLPVLLLLFSLLFIFHTCAEAGWVGDVAGVGIRLNVGGG